MAVRVRASGEIVCAALRPAEPGDVYLDDADHYNLAVERGLLVAEPWSIHRLTARWYWADAVPAGLTIERSRRPMWFDEGPRTMTAQDWVKLRQILGVPEPPRPGGGCERCACFPPESFQETAGEHIFCRPCAEIIIGSYWLGQAHIVLEDGLATIRFQGTD